MRSLFPAKCTSSSYSNYSSTTNTVVTASSHDVLCGSSIPLSDLWSELEPVSRRTAHPVRAAPPHAEEILVFAPRDDHPTFGVSDRQSRTVVRNTIPYRTVLALTWLIHKEALLLPSTSLWYGHDGFPQV